MVSIARFVRSAALPVLLGLVWPGAVAAQDGTGRIVGKVLEAENGRPLNGAQVHIPELQRGSLTDVDGRFLILDVPAGEHEVRAEMIGYGSKTVTGVEVPAGGTAQLDISLESAAVEMNEVVVSAQRERGSSAYLLDRRRTSSAIVEAVGEMEIARRPDSDAAEVARRMTGVTVSDGKYVYIRGLGERYSQTRFNGSSLPSPEPEKEVVPLDLFPSGFLQSLSTQKSYTPDHPADFSGGSVEIETKDFPDDFSVRVGVGTSFNSEGVLGSEFLSYPGGGTDYLGFDDGSRDLPEAFRQAVGGLEGEPLPNGAQRVEIARAFRDDLGSFTPRPRSMPMNRSFNASIGGSGEIFGRELGVFLAGTYSDQYTVRDREMERKFRVSAFDPEIVSGENGRDALANVDYDFERGTRKVTWGTLGNLTLNLSPAHKLSLRTTVNVNTDDEARRMVGWNREDLGGFLRNDRLRYVSRKLYWGQLEGQHQLGFPGDSRVEWRGTLGRAQRDEPGLREALYLSEGPEDEFLLEDHGSSGRYFFAELVDDETSGEVDWSLPFELAGDQARLKAGGAYRSRDRDFMARRFNWQFLGRLETNLDTALTGAALVEQVRRPGEFSFTEVVEPGDLYRAGDERLGGYLMAEVPVTDRLEAIGGLRVEHYAFRMSSRGDSLAGIESTDLVPSLNLAYELTPDMKIRGAFSQTVDRAEFRELAPFQFTEATSLRQIFGNPDLEPADVRNVDLRWDWFPAPGEMVSAGVYYKRIDNPIEQVFFATAGTAYSYQNGGSADVMGAELDTRVGLGRLSNALNDFGANLNISVIESEVDVRETGAFVPTNTTRPLEGQAAYVLNAGLNFTRPAWADLEAGVYLNRLGQRLSAAGGSGVPDIYEQPRNTLDATLTFDLPQGGSVKLKGTNLLDAPYHFTQTKNGITRTQRKYWTGRTVSVGLSWNLY